MASEQMPRRENNREKEKEREVVSDRARSGNIVNDKEAEEGRRGRESGDDGGGVHHVRKFETKGDEKKKGLTEKTELERRTREVKGREWNEEEKQRRPRGKVEAEKARTMEKSREEAKGRENSETKEGRGVEQGGEEQGSGREETGEENKQSSLEEISRYRAEAQQKAINAIEGAKERYDKEKEKESATEASREKATEESTQAKDKVIGERTREVVGKEWNKEERLRNSPRGKVEAEKARPDIKEEVKGRQKDETKGGGNDAKHGKGRKETGEENEQLSLEEISKYRAEAQQKAMNAIEGAKERYEREKLAASEASKERDLKENEEATQAKDKKAETRESSDEEQGRGREENEQPSVEEISKYRGQAQQKSINAIEAAKERHDIEKQAKSEAAKDKEGNMQTNEEETQAKDATREKGKQGNLQAENETEEKSQKDDGATKDTIDTVDHNTPLSEKVKSSGDTASQYLGDKVTQAKDATLEIGKSAAKVGDDLKDKAMIAGWSVAHFSAEMTVEGTKVATNVIKEATEYAAQKASELASMSVDTAKGLAAAAAGENTKEYAERDLEAKREAQNQESEESPLEKTTTESCQRGQGQEEQEQGGKWEPGPIGQTIDQVPERTAKADESNIFGGVQERNQSEGVGDTSTGEREQKPLGDDIIGESFQGKGGNVMSSIGEKLGSAAQTIKKPLDKATEGGREVLGAVDETVVEIGEKMVIPTQKVQHRDEGVLNAIGETIAEIAETTRVIVAGEGEKDLIISGDYDSGKHGDLKLD